MMSLKALPNKKVAIIGAGAAGLVTARILKRNGIEPIVFEKDNDMGGVWSYSPEGVNPMYRGLRTNLPRELMAYREYAWGGDGKTRSFVTHREVKDYLRRYTEAMDIERFIQYSSTVTKLEIIKKTECDNEEEEEEWPRIKLEWETTTSAKKEDIFDAVCICNGHYASPSNPIIPGVKEHFKGDVMHSISYDDPSIFKDKVVLCVGGRASGSDLAREISQHAKHVYLSDTTCVSAKTEDNVSWVPKTVEVLPNSKILFGGNYDETPEIDVMIYCSGYEYQFPFIDDNHLNLSVIPGERRVSPLFEQLWHAQYPSLAFLGLQHSVVPFPFFELQAEAIVSQLLNKSLPPRNVRMSSAEKDANSGGPKNPGRIQDTHFLGSFQWDECLKYAKYAGIDEQEELQKYISTSKAIYDHAGKERKSLFPGGPDTYRYNSYVRDDNKSTFQCHPLEIMDSEEESNTITDSQPAAVSSSI